MLQPRAYGTGRTLPGVRANPSAGIQVHASKRLGFGMAPTKVTRPIKSRRNREHLDAAPPQFFEGDARDLRFLPLDQVDLILTSPPYWKRRDYGHRDQLGQERTPDALC